VSTGTSATAATGGAAGGTSAGANANLERCSAPLGTLAVDDGRGKEWYASFGAATQVTTIEPLLRLAVQQSNCFVITSVGNNRTESKLSAITDKQRNSGEFRAGSQQQKGQRVAADYYMEPAIIIDNESTGKIAGALGGLIGGGFGALAGSVESKASVVTLTMFDIRSGVQIAISEGNATATNYGAALGAFGGGAAAGLGGFHARSSLGGRLRRRLQQHGDLAAQLQGAGSQGRPGQGRRAESGELTLPPAPLRGVPPRGRCPWAGKAGPSASAGRTPLPMNKVSLGRPFLLLRGRALSARREVCRSGR
jgi:hypothetical protein